LDARNWSGFWLETNFGLAVLDDAVLLDDVVAAPLVDDLFISDELLASGVDGLEAAGGVALGLADGFGDDWAIAPDSAKTLKATPNMSLFNMFASKEWVLGEVSAVAPPLGGQLGNRGAVPPKWPILARIGMF
jgi:hypothetical protein